MENLDVFNDFFCEMGSFDNIQLLYNFLEDKDEIVIIETNAFKDGKSVWESFNIKIDFNKTPIKVEPTSQKKNKRFLAWLETLQNHKTAHTLVEAFNFSEEEIIEHEQLHVDEHIEINYNEYDVIDNWTNNMNKKIDQAKEEIDNIDVEFVDNRYLSFNFNCENQSLANYGLPNPINIKLNIIAHLRNKIPLDIIMENELLKSFTLLKVGECFRKWRNSDQSDNIVIKLHKTLLKFFNNILDHCPKCYEKHKFITPLRKLISCTKDFCLFQMEETSLNHICWYNWLKNERDIVEVELLMFLAAANFVGRDVLEPFPSFMLKDLESHDISGRGRVGALQTLKQAPELMKTKKLDDISTNTKHLINGLREHSSSIDKYEQYILENEGNPILAFKLFNYIYATQRMTFKVIDSLKHFQDVIQFEVFQTPERELIFQDRMKEHNGKSHIGFHGSNVGNWYSILRNHFKVMSNTGYMSAGAAYGKGVYTAQNSATSSYYARQESINGNSYQIMAIVEVAGTHKNPDINTVENPDDMIIRYLLIFKNKIIPNVNASNALEMND